MANQEHLDILNQGIEVWNQWREEYPDIQPDLSGANLKEANLEGAKLSETDLSEANLGGAKLDGADLRKASLNRTYLGGAKLWSAKLSEADLSGANLEGAKLGGADLSRIKLSGAYLSGANLSGLNLSGANLSGLNLSGANLSGANLSEADLSGADLSETDLSAADLSRANLGEAISSKPDFAYRRVKLIQRIVTRRVLDTPSARVIPIISYDPKNVTINLEHSSHNLGVNLSHADLSHANLIEADLSHANLYEANLLAAKLSRIHAFKTFFRKAALIEATLDDADLTSADLSFTDLSKANMRGANLHEANLSYAMLDKANLEETTLYKTLLVSAKLTEAVLIEANLNKANLKEADLSGANLDRARLIETNLSRAILAGCHVYGTAVWDVQLSGTIQDDLIITPPSQPTITVDNLKVAQFIYLLLNNAEIREVIDTITSKVVLILGRFSPERKQVLDMLRNELRKRNYLPVLFDFEKPASRDITETISTLAHIARFIIADLTDAKSIPQELNTIIPNLPSVPIQPLLLTSQREYSMFEHFTRFPWVLPIYHYADEGSLLQSLKENIIEFAEQKAKELAKH